MDKTNQEEILAGLLQPNKHISSKYFYDDAGSRIFQEIMQMPEYYLTNSEHEIFCEQSNQIISELQLKGPLNVVEFGAGDGAKTLELLKVVLQNKLDVTYVPVDISNEAITILQNRLSKQLPELKVKPKVGDYFSLLKSDLWDADVQNLYLFLGSNIGNYSDQNAAKLLQLFNKSMRVGDGLLVGVDLQKSPTIIYNAYFDPHGITKRFNLNLLHRLNRELNANFNTDLFDFECVYDPDKGEVKSYLVSLEDQTITILGNNIRFFKNERIWTELSKKYTLHQLEELAQQSGFSVKNHFLDRKKYFTNSLWIKDC